MSSVNALFPIADLESCTRLLCIQPHPDAAGGTIAKLVAKGCEVVYLTATDGSLGSHDLTPAELAAVRKQETAAVIAELGVKRSLSLGLRDYIRDSVQDIAIKVVEAIREVQPQMVMTVDPWMPYEAHPDHRKVGMAVADAMIFSGFELYPDIVNGKTYRAGGLLSHRLPQHLCGCGRLSGR